MPNKDQWTRQPGVHKIERKGKVYKNLVMFTRPCATCGASFGIYVSQSVANGDASNNNFSLKNCEQHRLRPVAAGAVGELEQLRDYKRATTDELASNYQRIRELFEETQALKAEIAGLKARLAQYELTPALAERAANRTTNGHAVPNLTFPWQSA